MKRYLSILLAAVTIFTVSCRKDNTKDNDNKDTKASPTMTVTATATPTPTEKVSETPVQSSDEAADATKSPEPQGGEDLTQTATTESTEPEETPSATQAVVTSNPTLVPSVNPTQTAAPTAKPTVKPTVAPKTTAPTVKPTAKPTVTVKPTAKPTATAKPTPTPTAKPTLTPYDDAKAQYWVDFAKDYALSIGLELVSDCTGCWDTPEVVYAKRTQSKIEKNLISRIDYYKEVGVKYVWVWYEKYDSEYAPTADAYQIYIGYGGLNEN